MGYFLACEGEQGPKESRDNHLNPVEGINVEQAEKKRANQDANPLFVRELIDSVKEEAAENELFSQSDAKDVLGKDKSELISLGIASRPDDFPAAAPDGDKGKEKRKEQREPDSEEDLQGNFAFGETQLLPRRPIDQAQNERADRRHPLEGDDGEHP